MALRLVVQFSIAKEYIMNEIENLYAYNEKVPGEPAYFEVQGSVQVAHPGIEPVLVEPQKRHRGGWEVLELKLVDNGCPALSVITEKRVSYRREGGTMWKALEIVQADGSQIVQIGERTAID